MSLSKFLTGRRTQGERVGGPIGEPLDGKSRGIHIVQRERLRHGRADKGDVRAKHAIRPLQSVPCGPTGVGRQHYDACMCAHMLTCRALIMCVAPVRDEG